MESTGNKMRSGGKPFQTRAAGIDRFLVEQTFVSHMSDVDRLCGRRVLTGQRRRRIET